MERNCGTMYYRPIFEEDRSCLRKDLVNFDEFVWGTTFSFREIRDTLTFPCFFFFHSFKNYNTMISFLITIICKIVADLLRGTPFQPRSFTNVSSNMIFTFFEGML